MSLVAISGNASGTGTLTIAAPNTNSNRTLNLPDGSGTFTVNGVNSNIVSGTAVASTSGTSIDFTSIPSWVKRITVMFASVSTNGSSHIRFQLGTSGGVESSGYLGWCAQMGNAWSGASTSSSGFDSYGDAGAAFVRSGHLVFVTLGSNVWTLVGSYTLSTANNFAYFFNGAKTLSGTLDRVRVTTVNGTDTFDAGSINILYE